MSSTKSARQRQGLHYIKPDFLHHSLEPSYPHPTTLTGDMARHSEIARGAGTSLFAPCVPGFSHQGPASEVAGSPELILPKASHVGGKADEVSRGFSSSRRADLRAMPLTSNEHLRKERI